MRRPFFQLILLLLLALWLDSVPLFLGGSIFRLSLVILVVVALYYRPSHALGFAFFYGLFSDIMSGLPFGFYLLAVLSLMLMLILFRRYALLHSNLIVFLVGCAISFMAYGLLLTGAFLMLQKFYAAFPYGTSLREFLTPLSINLGINFVLAGIIYAYFLHQKRRQNSVLGRSF